MPLKRLRVLMTREEIVPERLAGATAVVVDVFLATTTLLTILENGARRVFPVASLEEAEEASAGLDASNVLRGGEQDAARIEGYDHGPFPDEYRPETVAHRDVVFVTTNGTRAIADAAPAERVLLGCLRNAPAVARYLEASGTDSVYLVCAGSAGRFTVEDFLGAATILSGMNTERWRLNDGAWMALDFMERYRGRELEALEQSRAGRWFFEHDRVDAFEFVGEIGASELVPEVKEGKLGPASPTGGRHNLETISVREGEEFDLEAVERYLRERIEGLPGGELEVRQFPSGASNLTYLLKVGEWEGVLRRPPLGPIPPKAHDMGRESRILSRLHAAYPLAPKPYFFCEDESVIGAAFYVMERREGVVVDDEFPEGVVPTEELCRGISCTVADTLAELHAVDPNEAGLGDLGRPEGFLERQARGWIGRYDKAKTEEIEGAQSLTDWLVQDIPESPAPTIIHNDYKLNNLVLNPEDLTEVRAVLDWEMATVGDPLFDLAVSLSYWTEPEDPQRLKTVMPTVTSTPGFMTRREFMGRYAEKSGRDLSRMHWYMVFGYFKLAVILQQIYARWKKGQTRDERFADFDGRVRTLILHANSLAKGADPDGS
jgi:aminoglycoside phosphotransferase (APT) family kinase protein/phosphosulfolactate phosphohydrolase-like enzyme